MAVSGLPFARLSLLPAPRAPAAASIEAIRAEIGSHDQKKKLF
jgi:hypothetical protein